MEIRKPSGHQPAASLDPGSIFKGSMGLLRSLQCLLTARASSHCLPASGGFVSVLQRSGGHQPATAACTRSVPPGHSSPPPTEGSLSWVPPELSVCSGVRLVFPALLLLVVGEKRCLSRCPSLGAPGEPTRSHCHVTVTARGWAEMEVMQQQDSQPTADVTRVQDLPKRFPGCV